MEKGNSGSTGALRTKQKRLIAFYRNQNFLDCTFNIEGKVLKAHKLILACSSVVFEKMFFGALSREDVEICDIGYEDFQQMLEFIYTEEIEITSTQNAWNLYYAANKYLIDDLIGVCLEYVRGNLTMSNLVLTYEYADIYGIQSIKTKCLMDIAHYFPAAISSEYHMKPSTLSAALERTFPVLNKLITAVDLIRWAVQECEFRELLVNPDTVIGILDEVNITRYMYLDWVQHDKCLYCDSPLVDCDCYEDIVHQIALKLKKLLSRETEPTYATEFVPNICRYRMEFKMARRMDLDPNEAFVSFITTNKRMILFGVAVGTPMQPVADEACVYRGSVQVRVSDGLSGPDIAMPTVTKGVFFYESETYVALKELVIMEPKLSYVIRVSYENYRHPGMTAIHCYHMSNEVINEDKEFCVMFHDMILFSGTLIKGLSFYAA